MCEDVGTRGGDGSAEAARLALVGMVEVDCTSGSGGGGGSG